MQEFKVDELKPHPRNNEFFDDMEGEKWNEFLESVKTRGVIEPVIITPDKVIVSGHQRVRACKELGIEKVMCDVHTYDNDDQVLQDLLETNIRQRGTVGGSTIKMGRRILELERLYGVRNGSAGKVGGTNGPSKMTQKDLAEQLGINERTLKRAKKLVSLPSEIQEMVESGKISASAAARVIASLKPDEQEKLISSLPATKKLAQDEIEKYVDKIRNAESRANEAEKRLEIAKQEVENIDLLKQKYPDLQDMIDTGVITSDMIKSMAQGLSENDRNNLFSPVKVVEKVPDDYERLKKLNKAQLDDYRSLESARLQDQNKIKELKQRIKDLESREGIDELQKKLETEADYFQIRTYNYIQQNGGSVWITERLKELPDELRKQFISSVYAIDAFAKQMVENIGGYGIE